MRRSLAALSGGVPSFMIASRSSSEGRLRTLMISSSWFRGSVPLNSGRLKWSSARMQPTDHMSTGEP